MKATNRTVDNVEHRAFRQISDQSARQSRLVAKADIVLCAAAAGVRVLTQKQLAKARRLAETDSAVRVIKFRRNCGQTPAMAAGIDEARGDIIVMLDADGSTDPAEIPRFLEPLLDGADFVKGSRFLQGGVLRLDVERHVEHHGAAWSPYRCTRRSRRTRGAGPRSCRSVERGRAPRAPRATSWGMPWQTSSWETSISNADTQRPPSITS